MLTPRQLLQIVESKQYTQDKFWVDSQGNKHTINGSVPRRIVGGFEKSSTGTRRYFAGEALYYKV